MRVVFFDRHVTTTPSSGIPLNAPTELRELLDKAAQTDPFFCELAGDNGYKLLIGVGKQIGCIQYSATDGSPPYFMALARSQTNSKQHADFLIGDTATPISMRYCFPFGTIKDIAAHFLETGQKDPSIDWEEI